MSGGRLEREREAQAVSDLLARASAGTAGLVVEGEPGIGKTTVLLDAASDARDLGFRVLSAQGSVSEVSYAYGAVADLLKGVDPALRETLPGAQRTALNRACVGDVTTGPGADERSVATAFLTLLERASANGPVLLVIDDAQWLDASSRAVIGFTARRLTGAVAMLLAFRTGDPESPDTRSWLQFRHPDALGTVRMTALSLGGVHALVAKRLGRTLPRPTIVRIYEISAGNPFFALELAARAVADGGATLRELPTSLAALVRGRIGDVSPDAASVLLAAASSAAPTVESVSDAVDMPTTRTVEVLESLEEQRIIALMGNRVRFTHPLFATGVYTSTSPPNRRAMHRRLADLSDRPELKARHLALAATTGDDVTVAALDAAADATVAQGAPAVAAELVEMALALGGDGVPRRIRAGELHFRAGSVGLAYKHLETALSEAPAGVLRCMALMWLGAVKAYDDDMIGAVEAMTEAVEEAGDNPALGLLCRLRAAMALVMTDRLEEALEWGRAAVELADQLGVPGLRSQALAIWVVGKFVAGRGVDQEALQTAVELEDPHGGASTFFRARATQAMISAYTGHLELAAEQMRAVQQQMVDNGTEVDIIWAAVHTAAIAVWSGRYAEADAAAHEAMQRAEQMGGRLLLVTAWTQLAAVAAYTGREAEARVNAKAAIDTSHEIGAGQLAKEPSNSLAFLEVSLGNYTAAVEVVQPYLDSLDAEATEIEGGGCLPDAVEALTGVGRADDAQPLVEALERNGTRLDRPWMLAMAARGRSHILAARGDLEAAQGAAEEAMGHHARLPMPFEAARTLLLLGQLQRRRRRRSDATASLTEALDVFERLGAPIWAARAKAELVRLTGPRGDGQVLTAGERRIAERAASGSSNREIAAELFISEKTVEMNLSRTYRKLGIRSRAGLSGALGSADD